MTVSRAATQADLEEVVDIFEDKGPGSIAGIGTPAWKTRNMRKEIIRLERNEISSEEKIGFENKERI